MATAFVSGLTFISFFCVLLKNLSPNEFIVTILKNL